MTRFLRSPRKALLSAVAGAVALSSLAVTPAQAGNDDLARALIGIGAIAIIGSALANESRAQPRPDQHHHQGGYQQPRPRYRLTVSDSCQVRTRVNGYNAVGYDVSCARRSASMPERLPQQCLQRIDPVWGGDRRHDDRRSDWGNSGWGNSDRGRPGDRRQQGPEYIYRKSCMQQYGWSAT